MSEERYLEIQDFLEGRLSEEKAAGLRRAIADDEQLASDVAFVRLEREMQDALLEDEFLEKMKRWQSEKDTSPDPPDSGPTSGSGSSGKSSPNRGWFLLLLPLLAAGAWWFLRPTPGAGNVELPPSTPTTQQQPTLTPPEQPQAPGEAPENSAQPVQTQPARKDVPIAKQGPSDSELLAVVEAADFMPTDYFPHGTRGFADDLAKAENARKGGDFDIAISLYEKVAKENSNLGLEAAWNLGLLYFEQGKFKQATTYFEKTANTTNFLFNNDARYKLGLCQIVSRQPEKALVNLQQLLRQDYFEQKSEKEKVEKLIKKLQSWK